jgi:hypothetical protein
MITEFQSNQPHTDQPDDTPETELQLEASFNDVTNYYDQLEEFYFDQKFNLDFSIGNWYLNICLEKNFDRILKTIK